MRRVLITAIFIGMLLAIDIYANDFRFTTAAYLEVKEFGRLVNRFAGHAFDFLG